MAAKASKVLDEYQWEKLPDMPTPRCYSVAAHHEGKLYVIGMQTSCKIFRIYSTLIALLVRSNTYQIVHRPIPLIL